MALRCINQILILFAHYFSSFPTYPFQGVSESALVAPGVAEEDPVPKAGDEQIRGSSWPKSSHKGETDPESFNQLCFSKQFLSLWCFALLCCFRTVSLSSCTHEYKIGHYIMGRHQVLVNKYTFKT